MANLMKKKNNKNNNMKTLIATETQVKADVLIFGKTFVGTCYLLGVMAVAVYLIFAAIGLAVQPAMPSSIITLATSNSVTLTWTAPGDDNNIGLADHYDIRYSTAPITADNFSSAIAVPNPPQPSTVGSTETFEVTGLSPDTLYYFALKTADEVPNWSAISNIAEKRTSNVCIPDWSCTRPSVCQNSIQTRDCIDLNNCGTDAGKPETRIACTEVPPVVPCQENWSCTAWTDCAQNIQTRVCNDQNVCGTTANKPLETIDCAVGGGERNMPQEHYLAVSPAKKYSPRVKVYDKDFKTVKEFDAYAANFKLGVNVSLGDVDGDGKVKYQFFAYPANFRIGVSLATGDLDGDGREEIIVAPQERGGPQIRIFKYQPSSKSFVVYKQFFVYPTTFRLGLNLASADLDNNGRAEIIVAPISVGGPHVRVFALDPVKNELKLRSQFFAYALNFFGGVNLAAGDVDNDGIKEIIAGPGSGGAPHVRIFNMAGKVKYQFFAASTQFRGGISVSAFDYDLDGADEVLTGTYSAGLPGVIAFQFNSSAKKFTQEKYFLAYPSNFREGIRISAY
jgi:hypothetical protein